MKGYEIYYANISGRCDYTKQFQSIATFEDLHIVVVELFQPDNLAVTVEWITSESQVR